MIERFILKSFLVLALCLASASFVQANPILDDLLETCETVEKVNECKDKLAQFEKMQVSENDLSLAYFYFGMASAKAQNYKDGIEAYTKSLDLVERATGFFNRSKLYRFTGKPDIAMSDLKRAIELDADYGRAWLDISELEGDDGNYKASIDAAKQVIRLQKDISREYLAIAYLNIGFSSRRLDLLKQSEIALIQSLTIDPKQNITLRHLVRTYLRMRNVEKAEVILEAAFAQEPDNRYNRSLEKALIKLRTFGTIPEEGDL